MTFLKIQFNPEWEEESSTRYIFKNNITNECFEYYVKGVGQEALAEDDLEITANVREMKEVIIPLTNPYSYDTEYKVKIDSPCCSGAERIRLRSRETGKYKLVVNPRMGGEFAGSVFFTDKKGRYMFYMLKVKANSNKS